MLGIVMIVAELQANKLNENEAICTISTCSNPSELAVCTCADTFGQRVRNAPKVTFDYYQNQHAKRRRKTKRMWKRE